MAQKYIIGDLVKYKVGGLEFIAEIINTSKYGYCFKGVSDDISGTLCKEFAKDIPLTPEILQKNGWKKFKRPYSKYSWYRRKGYPTLNIRSENEILFYWGDHNENITTIHKLQHLLFGLNLNSEMEV